MRKTMKVGVALLVGALLSTGCGSGDSTDDSGLRQVKQVNADPSLSATTAFHTSVPDKLGYFADEGLSVSSIGIDSAEAAAALVQSGKADVVQAGGPAMVQFAGDKDDSLVAVYLNYSHSFRVVVPESSDIQTAADLKGKTIGSVALAGSLYQYGRAVLEQGGLDPDSDAKFLPVGYGTQAASAFEKNEIQAYAGADVFNAVIGQLLGEQMRVIEVPSDTLPAFGGWLFRKEMVENDRDAVVGFIRATVKGMIFAEANPAAALDIHWNMFPNSKPPKAEEDAVKEQWRDVMLERIRLTYFGTGADGLYGTSEESDLKRSLEFQVDAEMLPAMPDLEQLLDLSLAEDYNDFDVDAVRADAENY